MRKNIKTLLALKSGTPAIRGGEYRKWYGNNDYIIDWQDNGYRVMQRKQEKIRNCQDYRDDCKFIPAITWTSISSSKPSFRLSNNALSESAGMTLFTKDDLLYYCLAFLNSNVAEFILLLLNPTLNFTAGSISALPLMQLKSNSDVTSIAQKSITMEKDDWDSFETSWDFKKHPLV